MGKMLKGLAKGNQKDRSNKRDGARVHHTNREFRANKNTKKNDPLVDDALLMALILGGDE